ncbi:hypothetical protein [Mangrovihabitans endophyticus]|uniref:ATP synthase protein I n=1 Tax=Mangrovihabitans endophyticus TaxID=1751298 RepID=A0A8J3C024_9ACTN|nr:hypothetical protein [Mangrovihabitans endophyticus]GGK99237.1 hypothetical protein GCM10012284_37070 [Mangrovihabitans endophyticus]
MTASRPPASRPPASPPPASRPPGVVRQILGRDEDDDRPLPELPPLPDDPKWRIEHLGMISAVGVALSLCVASAGFLTGGPSAGLGAGAGVLLVAAGFTLSTLTIAWADVIRPALVMPVGLAVYVVKYALIALVLVSAGAAGWSGARPMAWGIAGGAVAMTGVQIWWLSRVASRRLPGPRPAPEEDPAGDGAQPRPNR